MQCSEKKHSETEVSQPTCSVEGCRPETPIDPQWDSFTQSPDPEKEASSVVEDEVSDTEQIYAVILQAKREKLYAAIPQLQRGSA